jgi:drug/metabolite transporter (DMT)-like permease
MKARLVFLILCYIWGSTWLFIKLGLEDLPPLTFAGIRFVIACSILLIIIRVRGLRLPRSSADLQLLALTGFLSFTVNYGTIFWGEQHISSGLAAVLQATIPVFGLVIAHFYLPNERMTWTKLFGVVLGIMGVAVVFSDQLAIAGGKALAGSIAVVVGSAVVAYSNVLVKARAQKMDPVILAAGQMFFGLIPLLLIGIPLEGNPLKFHWTLTSIVALAYLAVVGSVIAFILYYWLVHKIDVTKSMLIALVTPVVAVILGMIVLREQLNWQTIVGGAMIMLGVGFIVKQKRRRENVGLVTDS